MGPEMNEVAKLVAGFLKPIIQEAVNEELKAIRSAGPDPEVTRMEVLRRKECLTTREVEILYSLKANTLRALRSQGRGPAYTQDGEGRSVLYRRADVEAWLKNNHVRTYDQKGG